MHRSFAESDERTRTIALEGGQERIQAAHALQIRGPLEVTGIGDSPSRSKIFVCKPTESSEERRCATEIVTQLAERAFRRPVSDDDLAGLMRFYDSGIANGGFESGVRDALSAVLASPHFIYRAESAADEGAVALNDLELASRLSFFLWSSLPDQELLELAERSRLGDPDVLAAQVKRMLADERAESLVEDFAFQWLDVAKLDEIVPDRGQFPHASGLLDPRALMKEELKLFVDSVLRSDRSVVDLLTADYTFLNERLAMHYGIESVKGARFRRVTLADESRYGLLGKGAVLMLTAYPNRTSPVLRGAWIQERLVGSPVPAPPPDVPDLTDNKRGEPPRTLRARLEQHRENPTCFSCHGIMDPLGFALESFNAVGQRPHARPGHAHADRRERDAARRHGGERSRGSAPGAHGAPREVRAGADREPVHLRARSNHGPSRHADGARDRATRREGRLPVRVDRSRHRFERCLPQARGRRPPGCGAVDPLEVDLGSPERRG